MNILRRQCLRIFSNAINIENNLLPVGRLFSYKSAFSLENIYPTSNMRLHTPNFVPEDENQKFNGYIPMDKIKITYSRSSGPGGQNVNKVNTKVDIRFNVKEATWLHEEIKTELLKGNNITKEGCLLVKSDLTSSQLLNVADALSKLRNLIRKTLVKPKELSQETKELIRKRRVMSSQRRVHEKRMRSQTLQDRRATDF